MKIHFFLKMTSVAVFCVLTVLPVQVAYAGAGESGHHHDHSHSGHKDADSMEMGSKDFTIKGETVDGVSSHVVISDISAEMKKSGRPETHRLTATFKNTSTGKTLSDGRAAINFTESHDQTGKFSPMKAEKDSFTTEIMLHKSGEQHFLLATVLDDGQSRKFHFHFTVK